MPLELVGYVDLPPHVKRGGFDHAAVYPLSSRLYAAHTANDALDVIDCAQDKFINSIPGFTSVAGALVSEEDQLIFTSNRGENTVSILSAKDEREISRVRVGMRPNGLAYDPRRKQLLAANVGDPAQPNSLTLSIVKVGQGILIADLPAPGLTRWSVFDPLSDVFYVNIADPPLIIAVESDDPTRIARQFKIPAEGPHGLDLDAETRRLFCACDAARLIVLDADSGKVHKEIELAGAPDVIFFNKALDHLHVAIGNPGVMDVIDTSTLERIESVPTEVGAHTIAFDEARNKVYAFLPVSHRAGVYLDRG